MVLIKGMTVRDDKNSTISEQFIYLTTMAITTNEFD
jgi:hypothetical protein